MTSTVTQRLRSAAQRALRPRYGVVLSHSLHQYGIEVFGKTILADRTLEARRVVHWSELDAAVADPIEAAEAYVINQVVEAQTRENCNAGS
ncbi:hypothetical protein ELZ19_06940 [Brucella abortus]|uniref:hypothetical protein n=1 Tax=Brucella abortus TaxID=235 RepID=UPI0004E91E37|nr:hypothetical protein [Brucella abortus]KFH18460.1 hypothetical protein IB60_17305 [Brucella abortus LMN1]RUQ67306.1 hypothetical protein ELZ23_15370 [Brucella abortus]RUQ78563.1 hypothetical protein ELZ22_16955 [Brucella abortus]RUQ88305.1 hypothetical protein ELZ18_15710 [Brucella abortus]RUQ90335.1 hypothetical protein ELZ20_15710 [Brucella abortus]